MTDGSSLLGWSRVFHSVKTPAGAFIHIAAGNTRAGMALTPAPGGGGEFAAHLAAAAEFARRGEGAPIRPAVPFIRPADVAIQTVDINGIGLRLVLAIHVAADDVAKQTAADHAAHGGKAVAMAGKAADQAAC